MKSLVQLSGQRLDEASPEAWLWHDRRVVLTDGSTLSMPDSQDNQAVYPQPSTSKKTRFSDPENLGSDHTGERRCSRLCYGSLGRSHVRHNGGAYGGRSTGQD